MGEGINSVPVYDCGNGVENYECDGCRNDGFSHMGCNDCPHNEERIREYERKYCR